MVMVGRWGGRYIDLVSKNSRSGRGSVWSSFGKIREGNGAGRVTAEDVVDQKVSRRVSFCDEVLG